MTNSAKTFRFLAIATILPLLSLNFIGCSEDEAAPSRKEILLNSNWIITDFTFSVTSPITDSFGLLDDAETCDLDNEVVLQEGGTFIMIPGATLCAGETNDAILGTGGWSISNDETTFSLLLTDDGGVVDFEVEGIEAEELLGILEDMTITELTATTFKATKEQVLPIDVDGFTVNFTINVDLGLTAAAE